MQQVSHSESKLDLELELELPVLLSMPGRRLRVCYLISGRKLSGNMATFTASNCDSHTYTYL